MFAIFALRMPQTEAAWTVSSLQGEQAVYDYSHTMFPHFCLMPVNFFFKYILKLQHVVGMLSDFVCATILV